MGILKFTYEEFTIDHNVKKSGGQASVEKGRHPDHGDVAIKWHYKRNNNNPEEAFEEAKTLAQSSAHQNIIQFIGILINEQSECIGYIMPYMSNGNLHDSKNYLYKMIFLVIHDKSQQYDKKQVKSWIIQICNGLYYLHSENIIHRDIKPSNILLGKSCDDVKLSDFGTARSLKSTVSNLTTGIGTPTYMAPEVLRGEEYDISVDIYSLSITIWEILQRRIPYDHVIIKDADSWDLPAKIRKGVRPEQKGILPKKFLSFLMRCWHDDASKRPVIGNVLEFCKKTKFQVNCSREGINARDVKMGNTTTLKKVASLKKTAAVQSKKGAKKNQIIYNNLPEKLMTYGKEGQLLNVETTIQDLKTIMTKRGSRSPHVTVIITEQGYLFISYPEEQKWTTLAIKLIGFFSGHGTQFVNDALYFFGGYPFFQSMYKLTKKLTWERMADIDQGRYNISNSIVVLKEQIWIMGGSDEKGKALKSLEMYETENNKWSFMREMVEGRVDAAAAVVSGKIFCCGGRNEKGFLSSIEYYDPPSNLWTLFCSMPELGCGIRAVEFNKKLFIIGNDDQDTGNPVWVLNAESYKWIEKPRTLQKRNCFSAVQANGELFICGGFDANGIPIDSVEIFDRKEWRNGPKLPVRSSISAVTVASTKFINNLLSTSI